ncbi:MAG: hypothetical protein PHY02_00645 [Phycisphaerae bacterium]|nr:hypothetical protein [Phycisphaerae bacterium]
MKSRFYFVFVVFCFTAVLILTVFIRSADNRIFYKICKCTAEQNRLKQQLWQKQIRLENLINPAAVSHRLDRNKTDH